MTPPHWLLFPTPAPTPVKVQVNAELVSANATSFHATNVVISGTDNVASNYTIYGYAPFRKSTFYIELLLLIQASGDYADTVAWNNAVTSAGGLILADSTWTHDGADFNATSLTINNVSRGGTLLRLRWFGSSTDVTNFWNTMAAGETTQVKLNWA